MIDKPLSEGKLAYYRARLAEADSIGLSVSRQRMLLAEVERLRALETEWDSKEQALQKSIMEHEWIIAKIEAKYVERCVMSEMTPRAIVQYFAAAMEAKLSANEHKPGWKQDGTFALLARARQEFNEFVDALNAAIACEDRWMDARRDEDGDALTESLENMDNDPEIIQHYANVLAEAADVSNFLMMICDVMGALPPTDERGGDAQ